MQLSPGGQTLAGGKESILPSAWRALLPGSTVSSQRWPSCPPGRKSSAHGNRSCQAAPQQSRLRARALTDGDLERRSSLFSFFVSKMGIVAPSHMVCVKFKQNNSAFFCTVSSR